MEARRDHLNHVCDGHASYCARQRADAGNGIDTAAGTCDADGDFAVVALSAAYAGAQYETSEP